MYEKKRLRRIKTSLAIMAILVIGLYIFNKWEMFHQFDESYPEITFDEELLNVSVSVGEDMLLKGVHAVDQKDGDVTESIIIESMSHLLDDNQRIITYAAFDGDNHVGKAERRIQYTDYKPIRFSLEGPLMVADYSIDLSEILAPLKVVDCIDGDLSDQIVVVDSKTLDVTQDYTVIAYQVQVTNSCGEVETLDVPVKMSNDGTSSQGVNGIIQLTDYLVYRKKGDLIDPHSYIENINLELDEEYSLNIDTKLDSSVPGVYRVIYSVTWGEDNYSETELIVVVEE